MSLDPALRRHLALRVLESGGDVPPELRDDHNPTAAEVEAAHLANLRRELWRIDDEAPPPPEPPKVSEEESRRSLRRLLGATVSRRARTENPPE